jgi:hypothetical protein
MTKIDSAVFDPEAPFGPSSWPRADPKGAFDPSLSAVSDST